VSRHRAPGRRAAPGRVKRLPDGLSRSRAASFAAKSAAGLGVVGGAAVALSIPLEATAQAATAAPSMALTSASALQQRTAVERTSRDATRTAPAVTAPAEVAPVQAAPVGVSGVKAVAKPKPKPEPTPAPTSEASTGAPAVATGSYGGGITSTCASIGLIPNAQRLCSAVQTTFGLTSIGGYRPGGDEHGTGQAIDFMISSPAQGDAIAAYVQQHVAEFNVQYVIWQQRYWEPGSSWSPMADRGSITANHYDHVHVTIAF
jgi:hypothetical protein